MFYVFRFILVLIIIFIIIKVFIIFKKFINTTTIKEDKFLKCDNITLVKCHYCGIYVSQNKAYVTKEKYFCSREHLNGGGGI